MSKVVLLLLVIAIIVGVGAVFVYWTKTKPAATPNGDVTQACTADAKICADGSTVGREGPDCEFAACPGESTNDSAQNITTKIGTQASMRGVSILPVAVVSDSRCPANANCVWPGTVELTVQLTTGDISEETTLTLGQPYDFSGRTVTLSGVSPIKAQDPIPDERYSLAFSVGEQ